MGIACRDEIVRVFFSEQRPAYEDSLGLVGSEVCIRDRRGGNATVAARSAWWRASLAIPDGTVYVPARGVGVLLLAAARAGSTGVVGGLVRRGVHLGFVDHDLNTPLHLSLSHEHEACALELLQQPGESGDHGLKRNVRWHIPYTLALERRMRKAYRAIKPPPGDKDVSAVRAMPLLAAAQRGDVEQVRLLLESEALEGATPRS